MSCERCGNPKIKARGLCRRHYEEARTQDDYQRSKRKKWQAPSDEVLIALMQEHESFTQVCSVLGIARLTLRKYLETNPALNEKMRACLPIPLSEEQKTANAKSSRRKWRAANPEKVRRNKRAWAGSRDPDVVRGWNRKSADRRRDQLAAVPLSAEEALLSQEYEKVLLAGPCAYCGDPATTVDHIVPVNAGGSDSWDNKCGACRSCNSSKRDKSLLDFLLWTRERIDVSPGI